MLVLTRRVNEGIVVPDLGLTITVVAVRGTAVRLTLDAPPGVIIYREEVWERLQAEEASAAQPTKLGTPS